MNSYFSDYLMNSPFMDRDSKAILANMFNPYSKRNLPNTLKRNKKAAIYSSLSEKNKIRFDIFQLKKEMTNEVEKVNNCQKSILLYQLIKNGEVGDSFVCDRDSMRTVEIGNRHSAIIVNVTPMKHVTLDIFKGHGFHRIFRERVTESPNSSDLNIKWWTDKLNMYSKLINEDMVKISEKEIQLEKLIKTI